MYGDIQPSNIYEIHDYASHTVAHYAVLSGHYSESVFIEFATGRGNDDISPFSISTVKRYDTVLIRGPFYT